MIPPISVSDASPTSSGATANLGGGVTFGSMGSGSHKAGNLPDWAMLAALAAAVLLVAVIAKKRR